MWFRYLVTFLDLLLILCILFFMRGFSFKDNKAFYVGFGTMMFGYIASAIMMWV